MKPYHRACGSTDLDIVICTTPSGKMEAYDCCLHCAKIIESHEIQQSSAITNCVSKVTISGKEVNHHFIDAIKSQIT